MPSNAYTRMMLRNKAFREMIRRRDGFAGKGKQHSNKWDLSNKFPKSKSGYDRRGANSQGGWRA